MSSEIKRISHSFPPDYLENNKYLAHVHTVFQDLKLDIDPQKVHYRGIKNSSELRELKLLHKEWFPPDYPQEFFDELFKNKFYKAILAVYDIEYKKQKMSVILGCITYEQKEANYDFVKFSLSDLYSDKLCLYILTFGVINEVRNKGIGSALIKRLIQTAKENNQIKCLSLDVVHYNDQAVGCYKKNGFVYVMRQKNYYDIFGKEYDALVYCYYLNGGKKPINITDLFKSCCSKLNFPYYLFKSCQKCLKREKSEKMKEI